MQPYDESRKLRSNTRPTKQEPIKFTWGKREGLKDDCLKISARLGLSNLEFMRKVIAENIHRY